MALPLDPIRLPLTQNALIEASAGTGKTYTITTLYLRALLGLIDGEKTDDNISGLTPPTIEQILVVTFTEAATQEIRDRVRAKLKQTQSQITGESSKPDASVQVLLEEYVERFIANSKKEPAQQIGDQPQVTKQQALLHAYHTLQNAITLIDEASIFTIHGFCHRCLKQFAFETNASFEQSFEMDAKPTLYNALLDFWRKFVIPLQGSEFEWFAQYWRTPTALYKDLAAVIGKSVVLEPNVSEQTYFALMAEHQESVKLLKAQWQQSNFTEVLTNSKLKKNKTVYKRIPQLQQFIMCNASLMDFDDKTSWQLWGTESLSDSQNYAKNAECITHTITKTIDKLADSEQALKQGRFKSFWLLRAKHFIEQRAKQFKSEQQIINPDDLLLELAAALSQTENDDSKVQTLKTAIVERYPLAFIDEFQDTDPVQYQIFNTLYQTANEEQSSQTRSGTMILIGDPKQAIYKFRGADIYTYISAKQAIEQQQHYTLAKNWRSHPALVTSVNYLFDQNQQGFRNVNIPFITVGAAKSNAEFLQIDQQASATVEFLHAVKAHDTKDDSKKGNDGFNKEQGETAMAQWAAQHIANLLYKASTGQAEFIDNSQKTKSSAIVKANDVCVLVRNRQQANRMKQALANLNIASVFISRNSVFDSDLAKDLLRLLFALESENNEQKIKAACAGRLFNYSASQLAQLINDPRQWQRHLLLFQQAGNYWHKGQIAKALQCILQFADTFNHWQSADNIDAERLITDFRHLTELVQQEATSIVGSQKLLLWYEQQVTAKDEWQTANEEQQLRLESDNQLVQICTLHASKGLEYPIVYLPFVCEFKAEKTALYHSNKSDESEQSQGLTYRVDNRALEQQIAEQERLAEDLRLLYVAMTRPVHKLVIGLYHLKDRFNRPQLASTAIGQLLLGNELEHSSFIDDELISNVCQKYCFDINQQNNWQAANYQSFSDEVIQQMYQHQGQQKHQFVEPDVKLVFNGFDGEINNHWRMLSYSALAAQHSRSNHHNKTVVHNDESVLMDIKEHAFDSWPSVASDGLYQEQTKVYQQTSYEVDSNSSANLSPFTFPKGANAGSCLHWIMENIDFTVPMVQQIEQVQLALERYGIADIWLNPVCQWIQDVLDNPLLADNNSKNECCLAAIEMDKKLVEMEFYFSFSQLNTEVLSNALRMLGVDADLDNSSFSTKNDKLDGILKGFIDLTFVHNNKYYVLDYKSNYLGDSLMDYQKAQMQICMSDHNYYLQALIYIFALHRFLQQRLSNYDYHSHIGGAIYLFMRGVQGAKGLTESATGVYQMNIKYSVIEYLESALSGQGAKVTADPPLNNGANKTPETGATQLGFGFE